MIPPYPPLLPVWLVWLFLDDSDRHDPWWVAWWVAETKFSLCGAEMGPRECETIRVITREGVRGVKPGTFSIQTKQNVNK